MKELTGYDYDVAVIGGGPAGASSAYYASNQGLETILFEKKSYPREKPCGGALSPRCIPLLGNRACNAINCEIEELRLFGPSFKSFACGSPPGYFVRREEFDQAMALDARDAGAELMTNCPVNAVQPLTPGGYRVTASPDGGDITVTARYIILAAGLQDNNLIKRFNQAGICPKDENDYLAMCMNSETPIDNNQMDNCQLPGKTLGIFLGAVPNGYGWCFVKDGYINIGIGATALLLRNTGTRTAYNAFVENLKKNNLIPVDLEPAKERPFPLPFKRTANRTVFGNVLLVGDPAGFVSPVTGEGIYYAIKGGQLAAEAIQRNRDNGFPLTSYQENWKKAFGDDLDKAGYFLQRTIYKTKRRMEQIVALGRRDPDTAVLLGRMIYGVYSYRQTIGRALLRFPLGMAKSVFMRPV
jgi:geranylgeranyl reductase family protein